MPKLKKNQVRLTLDEYGFCSLELPNIKEDEFVADHVTFLTAIGILIKTKDEAFKKYVMRKWGKIIKEYGNGNATKT